MYSTSSTQPTLHNSKIQKNKPGVRKVPARDPNAPKKNLSAIIHFYRHIKPNLPNPDSTRWLPQARKLYGKLSPEEKRPWQDKADQDKLRYQMDLAVYNPPPRYDQKGKMIPRLQYSLTPLSLSTMGLMRNPIKKCKRSANKHKILTYNQLKRIQNKRLKEKI